jgi:hypothetical protein
MKQNTMLMIGGAVVVYLLWKKSQKEKTSEIDLIGEMPEEPMSRAIGGDIKGKGKFKYGASACQHPTNKIYTVCGQTCPNGHTKLSGAHKWGC